MKTHTLIATFLLTVAGITDSGNAVAAEDPIKITDSKLFSINYGIESLEHWIAKLKDGDDRRRQTLLRDHDRLQARFDRLPASEDAQYQHIAKRLKETRKRIESPQKPSVPASASTSADASPSTNSSQDLTPQTRRELANLERRLHGLELDEQRYRTGNPKQRVRVRGDVLTLKAGFERLPVTKHPDYIALKERLQELVTALQPAAGPLNKTPQQITATLNSLRKKYYETLELPRARDLLKSGELTTAEVDSFVAQVTAFREHADRDLPQLKQILDATGKDQSLLDWVQTKAMAQFKRDMVAIQASIDRVIDQGVATAKRCSELDVEKDASVFNNDSLRQKNQELFARTARTIEQAARLERAMGFATTWSARGEELNRLVKAYELKLAGASKARRLPQEVGTKELHRLATEVFKNKRYGVGEIVKQIVNSKVTPRDRTEHKVFDGRLETIVRVWDEFQVTTVEEEDGKLILYRNNLAKFSRAPRTTPIGTWILKQRFKSGEIARENVFQR